MNADPDLVERMRLLEALTDVNSRHLLGERHCAGAEIELFGALEEEARGGASPELESRISALRLALDAVQHEQARLADQRIRLERALAGLNAGDAS